MSEIQELFDRQEITDVMHSYCRFVDLNLPEKQVECFTIDAIADYYGGVELVGRDAILEMLKKALTRFTATCHTLSNIEINFESSDMASSVSYVQAWHRKPQALKMIMKFGVNIMIAGQKRMKVGEFLIENF